MVKDREGLKVFEFGQGDEVWQNRAEVPHPTVVADALRRLGPRKRAYEAVAAAMAASPPAELALQRLLVFGGLTKRDALGGGDTLDHLARLQAGPLAPGLEASALLTGLLEEVEDPARLDQQSRGTCTVSSATIFLARTNPAEYVRLVADVASVQGTSVTAGGPTITRQPDWNAKDDGGRTPSMRLLQPALMEYYNGPRLDYDNKTDSHKGIGWLDFPNGLKAVLEALTGKKMAESPPSLRERHGAS